MWSKRLDFLIKQAVNSLVKVSCSDFKCNFQYKTITLFNLIKKGMTLQCSLHTPTLTKYPFGDCILNVEFNNLSFVFLCPKGKTFHIYMNPYFHEHEISRFVCDTLEEGDTFVDVGAMGGLYSIVSSKLVGPNGKVISVEPNPDNLHFLQENIRLNDLCNITLVKTAMGQKKGKITLYYDEESLESTSAFRGKRRKSFETEIATLDSLTEKEVAVEILKIDTEGYDEEVIEGAMRTLQKTHYCIVETNNETVRRLLIQLGFRCETMYPSEYLLAIRTI